MNPNLDPCDEIRMQHAEINLAYDAADALVEWREYCENVESEIARSSGSDLDERSAKDNGFVDHIWHIAGQIMQQRGIKSRFDIGIAQQEQQT